MSVQFNKQNIAIMLVIGLVVVGSVFYSMSLFDKKEGDGKPKTTEHSTGAFAEPDNPVAKAKTERENYKSTIEVYEQKQKEEEEQQRRAAVDFEGFGEEKKNEKKQVPASVSTNVVSGSSSTGTETKIANSKPKTAKPKAKQSKEAVYSYDEDGLKKRGLVSASRGSRKESMPDVVTKSAYQDEESSSSDDKETLIQVPAVIHGDHTLMSGRPVKLRLLKSCVVKGTTLPAGQLITGSCNYQGERVFITVSSISYNGGIIHTKLNVYDNGQLGIYAPVDNNKDIATDAASNAGNSVRVSVPTPVGSFNIGGGGAISKKVQNDKNKVFIPSQYNVIISNSTSNSF